MIEYLILGSICGFIGGFWTALAIKSGSSNKPEGYSRTRSTNTNSKSPKTTGSVGFPSTPSTRPVFNYPVSVSNNYLYLERFDTKYSPYLHPDIKKLLSLGDFYAG